MCQGHTQFLSLDVGVHELISTGLHSQSTSPSPLLYFGLFVFVFVFCLLAFETESHVAQTVFELMVVLLSQLPKCWN